MWGTTTNRTLKFSKAMGEIGRIALGNPPITAPAAKTGPERIDRYNGDRACFVVRDGRLWTIYAGDVHRGIGVMLSDHWTLTEARDWARRTRPKTPLYRRFDDGRYQRIE